MIAHTCIDLVSLVRFCDLVAVQAAWRLLVRRREQNLESQRVCLPLKTQMITNSRADSLCRMSKTQMQRHDLADSEAMWIIRRLCLTSPRTLDIICNSDLTENVTWKPVNSTHNTDRSTPTSPTTSRGGRYQKVQFLAYLKIVTHWTTGFSIVSSGLVSV